MINAVASPSVDRRIHVIKSVLVGGQLTVRMHVPLAQEHEELPLGECWVNSRHWKHVESQVPCSEPWIFPLVRHREYVASVQMTPAVIPSQSALLGRFRDVPVAFKPIIHDVVVELLCPQQAPVSLSRHEPLLIVRCRWNDRAVELVGLGNSLPKCFVKALTKGHVLRFIELCQADSNHAALCRRHRQSIQSRHLGAAKLRIDRGRFATNDKSMESVFDVRGVAFAVKQQLRIRLVFREQQSRPTVLARTEVAAKRFECLVCRLDARFANRLDPWLERAALMSAAPDPGGTTALSVRLLAIVSIVSSDGIVEEHVLELGAPTNVVHDERALPIYGSLIYDDANMREVSRDDPRDEIASDVVAGLIGGGENDPFAREESLEIRNASVIDIRIRARQAPVLREYREVSLHFFMHVLLQVDPE